MIKYLLHSTITYIKPLINCICFVINYSNFYIYLDLIDFVRLKIYYNLIGIVYFNTEVYSFIELVYQVYSTLFVVAIIRYIFFISIFIVSFSIM